MDFGILIQADGPVVHRHCRIPFPIQSHIGCGSIGLNECFVRNSRNGSGFPTPTGPVKIILFSLISPPLSCPTVFHQPLRPRDWDWDGVVIFPLFHHFTIRGRIGSDIYFIRHIGVCLL